MLLALFLQPATTLLTAFSRFTVKWNSLRVAAFAGVALFSHRQVLFFCVWAASENGVVTCTREILVFSRSFHS